MLLAGHVGIIGGGFSGTLLAINLLRGGVGAVTLIEREPDRIGRGLAYGAAQVEHVLNVRASNMSAFPDQPGHFVDWLERRAMGSPTSFATRTDYGAYLAGLLEEARATAPNRITVKADEAIDLHPAGKGLRIALASGKIIAVDLAVIASGNLPPHDLPQLEGLGPPLYHADPWGPDITDGLSDCDAILLLGTGLTAIDCALTLDKSGFRGRTIALSRRGLTPHRHTPATPLIPLSERPGRLQSGLIRTLRMRATETGWRNAVDALRPFTRDIWGDARPDERARFLRHLRPFWDVHRHRIAPQVAERLDMMRADERLRFQAGKIAKVTSRDDGLAIDWRPRGRDDLRAMTVRRVINCTGPLGDLRRTEDPFLRSLSDKGMIRPDVLTLGIDVDPQGRAVTRDGPADARLFVVGPMTRGAHWEMVAVPDIRMQVWSLARYLTGTHWVGGEGL